MPSWIRSLGKQDRFEWRSYRVWVCEHMSPEAPAPMIARLPTGLIMPLQLVWNLHVCIS